MNQDRIEKYFFTRARKKEYQTRFLSAVKSQTVHQKKTLELAKDGKGADLDTGSILQEFETRLKTTAKLYERGKVTADEYLNICRRTMDISLWPSIIVEIRKGDSFDRAALELERTGFYLAENQFDDKKLNKFKIFNFLQVHIPPVQAFLYHIAGMDFTRHLFDAERVFKLPVMPEPDQGYLLEHQTSLRDMVFPDGFPSSLEGVGQDIKICIIDSGIDFSHPDFSDRIHDGDIENFTPEADIRDECGHGTHVAGIALGSGDGSGGAYKGISPNSRLLVAKVMDRDGSGTTQDILSGLRWAHERDADVVNLSLGNSSTITDGRSILTRTCDSLAQTGVVVCVSAGNGGPAKGSISSPGDAKDAICVAASDGDQTAVFSSRGPCADPGYTGDKPDMAAPGVDIISARSSLCGLPPAGSGKNFYTAMSGTSMSSPIVAGTAALYLSYAGALDSRLDIGDLKQILFKGAVKSDHGQGNGIIHGNRSFEYLEKSMAKTNTAKNFDPYKVKSFGHFKVRQMIDKGGFAYVYQVWDNDLKDIMALKVPILPDMTSRENGVKLSETMKRKIIKKEKEWQDLLQKALDEARNQFHMKHDAVVKVSGVEKIDGMWCIAMEYLKGGNLRDKLDKEGPLPVKDCLRHIRDLASALDYAHSQFKPPLHHPDEEPEQKPLLHYDIKPENILFDESGHVKLSDFGIARIMPALGANISRLVCSPPYAGPEQIKGKMNPRSEIWSLGAVFYEMLTGKICFAKSLDDKPEAVLNRIITKEFVPVREVDPDIPEPVADIVTTMLRSGKNGPEDDFDSMKAVLVSIDQVITGSDKPVVISVEIKKRKIGFARILMALLLIAATAYGGMQYAEKHHIDIPVFKIQFQAPEMPDVGERILQLDDEQQLKQGVAARNSKQYEHAENILNYVQRHSKNKTIQQKAGYYKSMVIVESFHEDMAVPERQKLYNRAIDSFEHFIADYPASRWTAMAHLHLGDCYIAVGKPGKAVSEFSYVFQNYTDPELLQSAEILLKNAKKKLMEKGPDMVFVSDSFWGKLLPNNEISLAIFCLNVMMFLVTPVFWRQLNLWLDGKHVQQNTVTALRWQHLKFWIGLLAIGLISIIIIAMTNYYTSGQVYENSIESIEKINRYFR